MEWPPQVRKDFAEQDGLKPEDFRWRRWPVSNVRLEVREPTTQRDQMAIYRCEMKPDTPHPNQYEADGTRIPDPVGIALAWVKFQLLDADSHDVLDEDLRDHFDGQVTGYLSLNSQLWHRLTPGKVLGVKLTATPYFFYLDENGGGNLSYCTNPNGYFYGVTVETGLHSIAMTDDGVFLVDGEAPPPPPEAPPAEYTAEELELQAEMEREHQRVERERREEHERMARQQAEIDAARDAIYARRGEYDSTEAWLFGVLADKTLDFGTVRKYVYRVADEVDFDLEEARKRRNDAAADAAANRKAEYDAEQARQAAADDILMVESVFDGAGATSVDEKMDVLRKLYGDDRFAKYRTAIEAVASKLGTTL